MAGAAGRWGVDADEAARRMAASTAIGRSVTAAEVADVVTFLASPRSVAITGDPISVGGGSIGSIHYSKAPAPPSRYPAISPPRLPPATPPWSCREHIPRSDRAGTTTHRHVTR